jgi:hypothetical protein
MTSTSTAFLQRIWHSRPALAQSGENNIVSSLAHAAVQLRRISAARENADENTQITTNNANFLKLAPGPLSKASFLDVPSLNGGGCLPPRPRRLPHHRCGHGLLARGQRDPPIDLARGKGAPSLDAHAHGDWRLRYRDQGGTPCRFFLARLACGERRLFGVWGM